ncbi:hypothetical protein CRENPOLYSF1_580007 [Crenothrix polyspora]|uniref:Uncharacterized protein n=1 Tax=Crenothrix polyspora TaxID=360316 RepID=A0A1R4HEM4_9GAMM|nr:hypothetical protein CRENPOLYSF1_580007 [Crenothrix polyspora]
MPMSWRFINYWIQQKIMSYRVQYSVQHTATIYTDRELIAIKNALQTDERKSNVTLLAALFITDVNYEKLLLAGFLLWTDMRLKQTIIRAVIYMDLCALVSWWVSCCCFQAAPVRQT